MRERDSFFNLAGKRVGVQHALNESLDKPLRRRWSVVQIIPPRASSLAHALNLLSRSLMQIQQANVAKPIIRRTHETDSSKFRRAITGLRKGNDLHEVLGTRAERL